MSHRADTVSNNPANTVIPVHASVSQKGNPNTGITVKGSGNIVEVSADYACWDTVANKFVRPEDTTLKDPK